MNKQGNKENPRGGIEWCHFYGDLTGYTANPVRGCQHGCEWEMPDGTKVICYAEAFADRLNGKGFFKNITFHPDVLDKVRRHAKPSGIFIDSMSDLFGQRVERGWIEQVIETMRACPQHVFFTLTKNPKRLLEFEFPQNVLVGMSAPPTFMYGKRMPVGVQRTWFSKGMEWLLESRASKVWVSLEPLTVDLTSVLHRHQDNPKFVWAVIGAGSDGSRTHQPDEGLFRRTLAELQKQSVFFKGNIDTGMAQRVAGGWLSAFPKM